MKQIGSLLDRLNHTDLPMRTRHQHQTLAQFLIVARVTGVQMTMFCIIEYSCSSPKIAAVSKKQDADTGLTLGRI